MQTIRQFPHFPHQPTISLQCVHTMQITSKVHRGLFIISPTGVLRQMTINDLPVGRSVDETLRLVKAFQVQPHTTNHTIARISHPVTHAVPLVPDHRMSVGNLGTLAGKALFSCNVIMLSSVPSLLHIKLPYNATFIMDSPYELFVCCTSMGAGFAEERELFGPYGLVKRISPQTMTSYSSFSWYDCARSSRMSMARCVRPTGGRAERPSSQTLRAAKATLPARRADGGLCAG